MEGLPELRELKKRGTSKNGGKRREVVIKDGFKGINCNSTLHKIDDINGRWVPLTEFSIYKTISTKTGKRLNRYSSYCKKCAARRRYLYECDDWYRMHLNFVLNRSKKRGIECVSILELDKIVKKCYEWQEGKDYYTYETMKLGRAGNKTNSEYMCVDRIDNEKGYIDGNIVLCMNRTNLLKSKLETFKKMYSDREFCSVLIKMMDTMCDNGFFQALVE